ncbi:hypothetical protein F5880DRAFT_1055706 [Lentinula raphanica]|nr:hypothetical protein F5880DRAFT_1055706 [Lentinula raphanica]
MATATLAQYLFYLAIHCASSRFHRLPYRISGRHCIAFPEGTTKSHTATQSPLPGKLFSSESLRRYKWLGNRANAPTRKCHLVSSETNTTHPRAPNGQLCFNKEGSNQCQIWRRLQ